MTIARSVVASRRVVSQNRAARRFTAIKRPTECYLLFSLSSLFARYVRFTTRIRGPAISSNMAAFAAFYRVFDLRVVVFSRSSAIYLCTSWLYATCISTDMYLHGKAQPVRFLRFALFMSDI